ncbi:radical SAM protein [Aquihabitans sp. McL0605]|uniref:radical SAM protein n=1 Tax=Aquihabitans sp. McL0605 TaxID=3415671 RepID=UPI003CF4ECC3
MTRLGETAVRLLRKRPAEALPAGVCRAPFTSMYLDQHGSVRACCQNTDHPLGNVTEARLHDIWAGHQARTLRDAMLAHDLDLGCGFCKWQVAEGNDALVFARTFDHLEASSTEPTWPQQLELSMSNACNLQCVMCNGDWSSAIRTHREGRPPLPQVYDEQFFDDLRPFLEHVKVVKILGGEPFLGKESLRVMEMLVEMGSTAEVHVTTNGTQWSPRVERILEKLPMVIIVSLDGVEKAGYESVRIGADLDVVLENIDRFRGYAATHGTSVNLAHCLMTSNWRQFPDFLRYAERQGLRAYVNTVTYPTSLSLFHLAPTRLREIIDTYEAADAELVPVLALNRNLWNDQLDRLRHRLAGLEDGKGVDYYLGVMGFPLVALDVAPGLDAARQGALDVGGAPPTHLAIDLDHRVGSVVDGPGEVLGVALEGLHGRDIEDLLAVLGEAHGAPSVSAPIADHPDVRRWRLTFGDETVPGVEVFLAPVRDDEGVIQAFQAHLAVQPVEARVEPSERIDHLESSFHVGRSIVHRIVIGTDGRVAEVEAAGTELGSVLAATVGDRADDLLGTLGAALGELVEMVDRTAEADGAMAYDVRFRADGRDTELEALVLPTPTAGLGPAGSLVLVSEREPSSAG